MELALSILAAGLALPWVVGVLGAVLRNWAVSRASRG